MITELLINHKKVRRSKKAKTLIATLMSACILVTGINVHAITNARTQETVVEEISIEFDIPETPVVKPPIKEVIDHVEVIEEPVVVESYSMSEEDIRLIALVTMAEAEGESEYGKRLVIDTILNRMDHERFPDTASEVIYQKNQFTSMWNGRVDRCYVMDDICQLVREELQSRTNYDVVFFTAGGYGKYGTPMFSEGNHYFASY
ncbi:MAG: cell wall hydrolase [Bacteroidales bacterium]|nr:cell wall hydrolase [Bacteroidales bacterium]